MKSLINPHKIMMVVISVLVSVVLLLMMTMNSSAQSTSQRLNAIEKQLNAIQRRVFTPGSRFQSGDDDNGGSNAVPIDIPIGSEGALMAEINIRISELETQIRQMTGQLEEANFKVNNLTRKLETLEKDNEFRFRELESGARPMASMPSLGAGSLPSVNTATPAALTAKQKYEQAYGLVSNANYVEAEIGFLEFLEQYPEDALSGNAQYWLGQTYYARGNYADATRTFLEGMSKYPDSSKAPAYLLKVGMSLNLLGEKTEACEVFRELGARFPDSTESTRLRPTEERKAGCS